MMKLRNLSACTLAGVLSISTASAAFHVMQIEQIIGGIDGNTAAQAVQLRMRQGGQSQLTNTTLVAYDAMGQNAVTLVTIPSSVSNSAGGSRILLTTPAFDAAMSLDPNYLATSRDFALTNSIPAAYLNGGKVTFQSGNTIYWAVAFGNYTGSNTGSTQNDSDGNFGAPVAGPLPSGSKQGIIFNGPFTAASTMNSLDYVLSGNPATVTNNAGESFLVVPEPTSVAMLLLGGIGLSGLIFVRRRNH
ncbi:MAG: PEP-CTERM sorting domain-containing protein [Chthoniobacteraceae bacterium]